MPKISWMTITAGAGAAARGRRCTPSPCLCRGDTSRIRNDVSKAGGKGAVGAVERRHQYTAPQANTASYRTYRRLPPITHLQILSPRSSLTSNDPSGSTSNPPAVPTVSRRTLNDNEIVTPTARWPVLSTSTRTTLAPSVRSDSRSRQGKTRRPRYSRGKLRPGVERERAAPSAPVR